MGGFEGRFEKLNEDVRQLAEKILEDQDLCKLIHYPDNNPLDQPNINGGKAILDERLLLFTPKIPLANETGTYVIIRPTSMRASKGEYYIKTILRFFIYCHKDIRDIYYYDSNGNSKKGDRALLIIDKIEEFMDNIDFSIGKANFGGVDEIANSDATVSGYVVSYKDVDFRNRAK